MPPIVHGFDWPDRLVIGTVGQPGERTFYLQARAGKQLVSVSMEKQQSAALAERIEEIRSQAGTVFLVSHSASTIRRMCNRVIWIDKGRVVSDGEPAPVIAEYEAHVRALRAARQEKASASAAAKEAKTPAQVHDGDDQGKADERGGVESPTLDR